MQSRIIISSFLILTAYFLTPLILNTNVHAQTPPAPQGPHVLCLSGQAAARLNWFPVEGATSYQVRLDEDAPSWDGCTSPDKCTSTATSEITFPIVPGKTYDWWVHTVNNNGWSKPAMPGVKFSCNIPIPKNLYYRCLPNATVEMRWQDTNTAGLYEVSLDADAPSWNGSCTDPDKCISVSTNMASAPLSPESEYVFWVQAKDTKGNKSTSSVKMEIDCANPPTPTSSNIVTPTATMQSANTPTLQPSNLPTIQPTDTPTGPPVPVCSKRSQGDANCDGTIDLEDEYCWAKMFVNNFLEVGRGCKHTNFNEADGTNILDFAIWYLNRES